LAGKGNTTIQPTNKEQAAFAKKLAQDNLRELAIISKYEPITIDDFDEIQERVMSYFERCAEFNKVPTVTGLALGIGLERDTFYQWIKRKPDHPTVKYLKKLQSAIAENIERGAMSSKINPVTGIFLLKANHGYREVTESVVTHKNELGAVKSEEEIAAEMNGDIIDADFKDKD